VKLVIVLTTVARQSQARELAGAALQGRLAACVQILPGMESHYVWQGRRKRSREFLLLAKTTAPRCKGLMQLWTRIHPYDCPEMVALTGKSASAYGRWVANATSL